MNTMLQIAALFFAELSLGSALVFPLIPIKVTGKSFARFYFGMILIFLGIFLFCLHRLGEFHYNYLFIALLALWIWALSFTSEPSRLEDFLYSTFSLFSGILLLIYAQKFFFHGFSGITVILPLLSVLASAAYLSFYLMNMIFGHWYLINRQLPIAFLVRTGRWLLLFTTIRLLTVLATLFVARESMESNLFARLLAFDGHGIFLWPRLLAGLGLPLMAAQMAWSSAKIGSNQSATGILYAGLVFVLMGEIMALYLYTVTGVLF